MVVVVLGGVIPIHRGTSASENTLKLRDRSLPIVLRVSHNVLLFGVGFSAQSTRSQTLAHQLLAFRSNFEDFKVHR